MMAMKIAKAMGVDTVIVVGRMPRLEAAKRLGLQWAEPFFVLKCDGIIERES